MKNFREHSNNYSNKPTEHEGKQWPHPQTKAQRISKKKSHLKCTPPKNTRQNNNCPALWERENNFKVWKILSFSSFTRGARVKRAQVFPRHGGGDFHWERRLKKKRKSNFCENRLRKYSWSAVVVEFVWIGQRKIRRGENGGKVWSNW